MKARLCVYLSHLVDERLSIAARRPGVSKSSIVDAALAAFLSSERDDQRDAAIIRRLDRISQQLDRQERDQIILSESLALFVRYYLTITPPLPEPQQDAARALGKERFDYFVAQVSRRVADGATMLRTIVDEITPEAEDFFTGLDVEMMSTGAGNPTGADVAAHGAAS